MEKKYKVFISSTYKDLVEERAAVSQTLLDYGCIPAGMEQFPSSNMRQMEYIEKMLNYCDYYILILAGRYGSLDSDGIGFTEKEYDYAISQNIPVMSFVIQDESKLQKEKCEDTVDKCDLLKKFKDKVCKNKLVKFYTNPDNLCTNVVLSLKKCIDDFPARGWIRGPENDSDATAAEQGKEHIDKIYKVQKDESKVEPNEIKTNVDVTPNDNELPKSNLKIGGTIQFGKYPQSKEGQDSTPIDWRILAKEDNKILVISENALDCKQYNSSQEEVTWDSCSLRRWLNNAFLDKAFSLEEQAKIQVTKVSADKNPNFRTNPGNSTKDKVFLLSITEAEKYFEYDGDRKCVPTEYAISQGACTSSKCTKGGKATCCWWLRSPGDYQDIAATVSVGGSVPCYGGNVDFGKCAVRHALWINLES